MLLYGFGFNGYEQLQPNAKHIVHEPVPLVTCDNIAIKRLLYVKILWSRIVAVADDFRVFTWSKRIDGLQENTNFANTTCTLLDKRFSNACCARDYVVSVENKCKMLSMSDSSFENFKSIVLDILHTEEDAALIDAQASEDGQNLVFITASGSLLRSTTSLREIYESEYATLAPLRIIPDRPLPIKVKQVSCGKHHTLFVSKIGVVFSFGIGNQGQLGTGSVESRDDPAVVEALEGLFVSQVSAGGWHSMALTDSGDIYVWGWNNYGQLGLPSGHSGDAGEATNIQAYPVFLETPNPHSQESSAEFKPTRKSQELDCPSFVQIACGSRHSLALSSSGEVFSWGWNKYGQLGYKGEEINDEPTRVDALVGRNVSRIHAGYWNSVVEVDEERLH